MRLCVDWQRLNSLLAIDSDGLGGMMFSDLKGIYTHAENQ